MERKRGERPLPETLPATPRECQHLWVWREWVQGLSQTDVALAARVEQPRISAIECGRTVPRKKFWPVLMTAFRIEQRFEAEWYRMLRNARKEFLKERALQHPLSDTPLLDPAQNSAIETNARTEGIQALVERKARTA